MSTFSNSFKLFKGGIVPIDPLTSAVQRIILLQYNPDTMMPGLDARSTGEEYGDKSEAFRLSGPSRETSKNLSGKSTDKMTDELPVLLTERRCAISSLWHWRNARVGR